MLLHDSMTEPLNNMSLAVEEKTPTKKEIEARLQELEETCQNGIDRFDRGKYYLLRLLLSSNDTFV